MPGIKLTYGIVDVKQLIHADVRARYKSVTPEGHEAMVTHLVDAKTASITFEVVFCPSPTGDRD